MFTYLSNLTLRGKITLTIALVGLCLVGASVLTYRSMQQLEEASDWTDHTYEVLIGLGAVEKQLLDLQTGQRGFLMTGDASYLEPHNRAKEKIKKNLEELRVLVADNPRQQQNLTRLVQLINERIAVLSSVLEVYKQRGLDAAVASVKTDNSKTLMDGIRSVLEDMDGEERLLLARRRTEEQVSRHTNDVVILLSTTVTLVFLTFIALLMRDDLALRSRLRLTNERLALQDALTGLPNRVAFMKRLKAALAGATRKQRKLAVLYFDLDGFKEINDSFGHFAGDQVLHKIAERAQASLRASDYLARLGGDEFVILLDGIGKTTDAGIVASTIINVVSQPVVLQSKDEVRVTASAGISLFPDDDSSPEQLIQLADEAMYRAKKAGKAQFRYHAQPSLEEAIA